MDAKDRLSTINEIAEIKSCNSTLFFECRKKADLFLWMSKTPNGPSVKFHVLNGECRLRSSTTQSCARARVCVSCFARGRACRRGLTHHPRDVAHARLAPYPTTYSAHDG